MGLVKHERIMAALERRALRYRRGNKIGIDHDKVLYNEALDETGTVSTEGLTDSEAESWNDSVSAEGVEALEIQEVAGVNDELLEVQGVAPGGKVEGTTRLIYENADGLQNTIGGNEKLQKYKDLVDELEADLLAINEHKMRLGHKLNRNGLSQMFNGGETEIRSVMGGNTHEKGGPKIQQGGQACSYMVV